MRTAASRFRLAVAGPRREALASLGILLLCAGLVAILRLPYLDGPHSADEAAYVTVAREILAGRPPLAEVWFNRSPPLYLWYALAAALPVDIDLGLQLVTAAAWALGAWVIHRILAAWCRAPWPLLGALLYAGLSADRSIQAESANAEPLLNLLLLASFWALVRWREDARARALYLAGFLAALAFLVKEQVVFFLPLVPAAFFRRDRSWDLRAGARFAAGFGVAVAGAIASAAWEGILGEWGQVLRFHAGYSALPWKDLVAGPLLLVTERPWALFGAWPLWLLATASLGDPASWERFLVAARLYLLAAIAMVLSTGHHLAHYYALALPPLVLVVVVHLERLEARAIRPELARGLGAVLLAFVAVVQGLALGDRVPLAVRRLSPLGGHAEAVRECGRRIAAESGESERLFVHGWEPAFYLYSELRPAAPDVWGYSIEAQVGEPTVLRWLTQRTAWALESQPPDWLVIESPRREGAVWRALALELEGGYRPSPICADLPPLEAEGFVLLRRQAEGRDRG